MDTPRAAGFAILELSKMLILRAHYDHFRAQYGDRATLLFTDTDSLCYLIRCEDISEDMLRASKVVFDLLEALPDSELERMYPDTAARSEVKKRLVEAKGKLGALKLENQDSFIVEYVGLASKMYSILMVTPEGEFTTCMKAKGVPRRVLKALATHSSYKDMVSQPWLNEVEFKAMRSKQHTIETLVLKRKMLSAYNDKVFQHEQLSSRPLGHWRNATTGTELHSEPSVVGTASSSGSFPQ